MTLKELLKDWVSNNQISEYADNPIIGLALNSRDIIKGYAFIALAGSRQHGMAYVDQAINNGACAVIYDPSGIGSLSVEHSSNIPMIAIDELTEKLGDIAARFYKNPSEQMTVIGITGTNGKTSCSQF